MAIRVKKPLRAATTKMTSYETSRDEGGLGGSGGRSERFFNPWHIRRKPVNKASGG